MILELKDKMKVEIEEQKEEERVKKDITQNENIGEAISLSLIHISEPTRRP